MSTFVKRTDVALLGAHTLPGRYFTSPEVFAEEAEKIFLQRWLCVGRASRIARPGQYFVQTIGTESVIIVRGRQNEVRAFYNVCRHRGTRLCEVHEGQFAGTIQCPYHAWTYTLDGQLVGAPSADTIEGFDKADWPLHPVAVATWEGFLFINLSSDPEPFAEAFAPVQGRFSRFNLPALSAYRRIDYDLTCNWKFVVQNYSECYHCPLVHPALVKLSPPTSGENDLFTGPFLGGYMEIVDASESLTMSGRSCGVMVGDLPQDDLKRVYYYSLFPNMLLSLHPDYVMYHTLWPKGPASTMVTCEWLFHPGTLGNPAFKPDDGVEFWDLTNRQDWHVCELSQAGVQSKAYTPGPYSRREGLSAAFDQEVLKALGHQPEW
ncbi:MAG TPA: aromatic ring-hydroxylating dioxygenase subunit alpha [Gemmatimonadales bacterium]|nr:aromatic ring-hydroxylating dioxygenase subunit alpha [Gemmatimonadales bacterium]